MWNLVAVVVELGAEHFESGAGVGHGGMRVFQVFVAIKLVGCGEGAFFHLVVDALHVDQVARRHVELNAGPNELFDEHGDVEVVGVVSCYVAS